MGLFQNTAAKAGGAAKKAGGATKKAAPEKPSGIFKKGGAQPRRNDDDDDGDGAVSEAAPKGVAGARVTSGWGGAKKLRQESATWAPTLQLKAGESVVIRFLEDEPYANVSTHWIDRTGRKSFICIGKACPLCARGDRPRTTYNFNVAQLTDGEPLGMTLEAKARVFSQIEEKAKDPKTAPLSKLFYTFSRTGSKKDDTVYTLERIRRASDIAEEFPDLHVPSADELEAVKRYTKEDALAGAMPKHKLEEVAAELDGPSLGDDDD